MPVHDLFSYRKRIADGDVPDVYIYDKLPNDLRVQIVYIWEDATGGFYDGWKKIHNVIAREHGLFRLGTSHRYPHNPWEDCKEYILKETIPIEKTLDLIEFSFMLIVIMQSPDNIHRLQHTNIKMKASKAIEELNQRFRRAGVGYQFENGKIIRVDSDLIHAEIVKPALGFLNQKGFQGPRDEFLTAHTHYRKGEMEAAVTEANKAFESTLKVICSQRNWEYKEGARASDLLKVVRSNGLLPVYLDKSFNQFVSTLQNGLPQVRNKMGAHGQGAKPRQTPDYIAAYALHLAATNIQFLVKAHKSTI